MADRGCSPNEDAVVRLVDRQPERPAVDVGKVLQFTAMALFTGMRRDVTAEAQWQVSEPAIAGLTSGGLADCRAEGTVTVSATFMGMTGATTLSCTRGPYRSF